METTTLTPEKLAKTNFTSLFMVKADALGDELRALPDFDKQAQCADQIFKDSPDYADLKTDAPVDRLVLWHPTTFQAIRRLGYNHPRIRLTLTRRAEIRTADPRDNFVWMGLEVYYREAEEGPLLVKRFEAEKMPFELSLAVELEVTYMLLKAKGVEINPY